MKKCYIFLNFAQNINYGYTLEPSTHNLCFRAKIRENVYPCKPQFYYIKVWFKGVLITRACLHDENRHFRMSIINDYSRIKKKYYYPSKDCNPQFYYVKLWLEGEFKLLYRPSVIRAAERQWSVSVHLGLRCGLSYNLFSLTLLQVGISGRF